MEIKDFPYKKFDSFVETFLVNKESYVYDCKIKNWDASVFDQGEENAPALNQDNIKKLIQSYKDAVNSAQQDRKTALENADKDGRQKIEDEYADKLKKAKESAQCYFSDARKMVLIHAIWLWSYPVNVDFKGALKQYGLDDVEVKEDIVTPKYVAGIGISRSQKQKDIAFILTWFKNVAKKNFKNAEEVKNFFWVNYKDNTGKIFSKNMLLHLCNPFVSEPIGLQEDKESIINFFSKIFKDCEQSSTEEKICSIRKKMKDLDDDFPEKKTFYEGGLDRFWKENEDFSDDLKKLQYKKAVMLYGPPGTGKTFEATEMAHKLIGRFFADKYAEISDDTEKKMLLKNFFGKNIFRVQFHVNYTYDDFVAGVVLKNNESVVRKGFIYDVIARANAVKDLPVVVILDEINRTDISRVFGELFSAIEYRGTDIDLSLKDPDGKPISLNIPKNVYFIGTMNEIDFSLERVDFALRRRFVWIEKTFNSKRLKKIIDGRIKEEFDSDQYVDSCIDLNKVITDPKYSLGSKYLIGHAFFAEIANIMNEIEFNERNGSKSDLAKQMLWDISILPTLEAYCGSMDEVSRKNLIDECACRFGVKATSPSITDLNNDEKDKTVALEDGSVDG